MQAMGPGIPLIMKTLKAMTVPCMCKRAYLQSHGAPPSPSRVRCCTSNHHRADTSQVPGYPQVRRAHRAAAD